MAEITDISKQFSPRRGKVTTMATTKANIVLAAGEMFIEYPDTGIGSDGTYKIKFGDGTSKYSELPYAFGNNTSAQVVIYTDDTSTTVAAALANAASGKTVAEIVAGLKQAITLVDGKAIYAMTVDGNDITVTNNAVSFDSPDYTVVASAISGGAAVTLTPETGYNKTASTFNIKGDGVVNATVTSGEVILSHSASTVTAGTYDTVTVDAKGHVTAGADYEGAVTTVLDDNLTAGMALVSDANGKIAASTTISADELGTLDGIEAIFDSGVSTIAGQMQNIHGEWITSGTIPLARIPKGAIGDFVVVADQAAMLALTIDDVQNGDVVKRNDTGVLYYVKDDTKLGTMDAFEVFKAGEAASVDWSNVQNHPNEFEGATASAAGSLGFVPAPSAGDEAKYLCGNGSWVAFTNATTAAAGLMSAEDKQVVELAKTGVWDFGDEQ